jgi:DNA polymerase
MIGLLKDMYSELETLTLQLNREIENCKKCNLWKSRKNVVIGNGSLNAAVMFIGEAPGYNEDVQGIPFVGRAGKFFDDLLKSVSLDREEVFVCNILKCRPPDNRNPFDLEIKTCTPFLDKQITTIKPKIIGTLGNFASTYVLEKFGFSTDKIGKIHGKKYPIKNLIFDSIIIPMYHPAAAVYNPNMKKILFNDFKIINNILTNK